MTTSRCSYTLVKMRWRTALFPWKMRQMLSLAVFSFSRRSSCMIALTIGFLCSIFCFCLYHHRFAVSTTGTPLIIWLKVSLFLIFSDCIFFIECVGWFTPTVLFHWNYHFRCNGFCPSTIWGIMCLRVFQTQNLLPKSLIPIKYRISLTLKC